MSYIVGTDLARLRELLGDTHDDELFTDDQLNDYLSECDNTLGRAAARALRRIANDPELLRTKYAIIGRMDATVFASLQRNLLEQAKDIENSELSSTSKASVSPTADSDTAYKSTDEDGWHKETTLDAFILSQERKR